MKKWLNEVPEAWRKVIEPQLSSAELLGLDAFWDVLGARKSTLPGSDEVFAAFEALNPNQVKVVILGQDPYHGPGQAHGLAFSVKHGVQFPPSLRNILKELATDIPSDRWREEVCGAGALSGWVEQGVLLLNTVLTVEEGKAGSHQGLGWEPFTSAAVAHLCALNQPISFVLWGKSAARFAPMIAHPTHQLITSPHPSPLSAHRGFFESKPFSQVNQWLKGHQLEPVDWWRGIPNA